MLRRWRNDEYGGYALGPQEEDRLDLEVRSFVYARASPGFRGRTAEEAATILGLRGAFWRP